MARKKSPQKRYADAVRTIANRGALTWKGAQKVYREYRTKSVTPLHAKRFSKLSRATLRKHLRAIQKTTAVLAYDAARDSENGDGDAAFSIQAIHGDRIEERVSDLGEMVTVTAKVQTYRNGVLSRERTLKREGVPLPEVMYAYHEMVRDDFESDDGYGEGVVTTGITVTP